MADLMDGATARICLCCRAIGLMRVGGPAAVLCDGSLN